MKFKLKDIEVIYHAALEKEPVHERSAYLDSACGQNSVLRNQVEALLKTSQEIGDFLEVPVLDSDIHSDDLTVAEGPGTVIGRYRLLEKIGEGGMAVVYMAEQQEPVRRKVAKIIKVGMDTKSVTARFEAERQALAMMDHANIAKILDGGSTETGRPYFVMDLVPGVCITKYCDKSRLSIKERLRLFISVCNAVQHAHQKGIIHRDIKPSNIMITLHDGKPVPKVIDFGIAKATNQRLTEKTLFTRYANIIGTPAYMSPEQAELSDLDVDTRTDIYSLGVLLYELLTGSTPFSEEELREAGLLQMQKIICEKDPTKPSTKLSTLGESLTDVANLHSSRPELMRRLICGDLDWIVMKSLEKDRRRRYDTASTLGLDVQRHLDKEPILARAPKATYRLQKFLQRHRSQTIAAASIALLVCAAMVIIMARNEIRALRVEARSSGDHIKLSEAREYFSRGDTTTALMTVESILNSEYVGSEARLFCASIHLHLAQYYASNPDKDKVVAEMEQYVNLLVPLEAANPGNRRLKDVLIGLWRGTATNLGPVVNSPSWDSEPTISADGCQLFFNSSRPGGSGSYDVWATTRETVRHPWGKPENLGKTINSAGWDFGPSITVNSDLHFSSRRPGGHGDIDGWLTTRASTSEPWAAPVNLGEVLNSSSQDAIEISFDGLTAIISSDRSGGSGLMDIWMSTRPTHTGAWSKPKNLGPIVNSAVWDWDTALSADNLLLFFTSQRSGGLGGDDLWLTIRATTEDVWSTPVNLGPMVNGSYHDSWPGISFDGSTFYFTSNRPGGSGGYDLWQLQIQAESGNSRKDDGANAIREAVGVN